MQYFTGSLDHTLGVEIELQIINPHTLDLDPKSVDILNLFDQIDDRKIKKEIHQSMLEIDTEICQSVQEVRDDLNKRLNNLYPVLDSLGLNIATMGTHPFQDWNERQISDEIRYNHLHQKFRWFAKRINVYGLHVHVGIRNESQAIKVMNNARKYLPLLLALSANSPFWRGIDTGMASSRYNIMSSFPYSGVSPFFKSWKEMEHYTEVLQKSKIISSFKDLYWFIRPNLDFGTIEFRICDVLLTIDATIAIVALIQCLVIKCIEDSSIYTLEDSWLEADNLWRAARDGLNASVVDATGKESKITDCIRDLIKELEPIAKNLNCLEELTSVIKIVENGSGADFQRKIYKETDSFKDIIMNCSLLLKNDVIKAA